MVITGGSRGIGRATALLAARSGYDIAFSYHERADAAETLVREAEAAGARAVAARVDVAIEDDIVALFRTVDQAFGALHVLVNNAGIVSPRSRIDQMTAERIARVLAINITGSFLAAREAVRRMSTRHGGKGGAIVNISSAAARFGSPGEFADYAASKGAIDTFTIGLAREVATEGIRVNGVRPGLVYTDIHASIGVPGRVDEMKSAVPMQRGGRPEEVAEAVLWLASDAASYCTGTTIDVSGGR